MSTQILIDSRESRSGIAEMLRSQGLELEQQELEVGDYVLAPGLGVERKAASDFVASILDRRLFSQAPLLRQSYERAFIILEGDVQRTMSAIAPEALLGAISYLTVIEGVTILPTANAQATAVMLATMHRHATNGLGYEVPLRGGKPSDQKVRCQFLVEGLPGIGPTAAKKLLEHLGTPRNVFTADPAALKAIPGVGPKTIGAISDVLDFDCRAKPRP